MRVKHTNIALTLVCLLFFCLAKGQTYTIPDAGFRQCLLDDYPSLLDASNDLIVSNANSLTDSLDCSSRGITNIDGVQHFTNITGLILNDNDLVSVMELSSLTQLELLDLNSNQLENPGTPSFTAFNALKVFKGNYNQLDHAPVFPAQIEEIYLGNNSLGQGLDVRPYLGLRVLEIFENDVQQITGFENLLLLERADLHTNELKRPLDLTGLNQLSFLDFTENEYQDLPTLDLSVLQWCGIGKNMLTFEDFLPLTASPVFPASFPDYANQLKPEIAETINRTEGGSWNWVLSFDQALNNNTYQWFKDGQLINTSNTGELSIANLDLTDAGTYHCEVSNANASLSGATIITNAKVLIVDAASCFLLESLEIITDIPNCNRLANVVFEEKVSGTVNGALQYGVVSPTDTLWFASNEVTLFEEGDYAFVLKDNLCLSSSGVTKSIHFDLADCEPASFSPNGDGLDDSYYIEARGETIIYDKKGRLVREIDTPAYWDGTDNSGSPLPFGYYIIVTGSKSQGVSLMK